MTQLPYHALRFGAALLLCLTALVARPARAQLSGDLGPGHSRSDLALGLGLGNGLLRFDGRQYQQLPPDMHFETALTASALFALQYRHWISRSFGLRISGSLGYLPGVKIPAELATQRDGSEASLQFVTHELEIRFLYRFHFGLSPTAMALQAELGMLRVGYQVQETEPPILVSTGTTGPCAALGLHLPLGTNLILGLSGGVMLPLHVEESPADSGRLDSGLGITLAAQAEYQVGKQLSLEFAARRVSLSTEFRGHGTRGVSGNGVFDAQSEDSFNQLLLLAHYRL